MTKMQSGLQTIRFMIMVFALILADSPVLASSVPASLNPILVKQSLQRTYAFTVGQIVRTAIVRFQDLLCRPVTAEELSRLTNHLLFNGQDFLIQRIDYVPEQTLSLVMQTHDLVELPLQGTKVVYHYSHELAQWIFDPLQSTVAIANNNDALEQTGLPDVGMLLITEYCHTPQGFKFKEGLWSDYQWCCRWFKFVMPPFDNQIPVLCSDETTTLFMKNGEKTECSFSVNNRETGQLVIPRVALPNDSGGKDISQVKLCHVVDNTKRFEVCEKINLGTEPHDQFQPGDIRINPSSFTIPAVIDTDNRPYEFELKAINDGEQFEVINKIAIPKATEARVSLQRNYAFWVWQKMKNALNTYQGKNLVAPKADIEGFAQQLLRDDPLIQAVQYEPEQHLIIIMHSKAFVEPQLQGKQFIYKYYAGKWIFDTPGITSEAIISLATRPTSLLRDVGMSLITEYCPNPHGYQYDKGMLPDTEWCPLWLKIVMPK
ncbi:MAG: hypothetical protein VSS75_014240 [Candidatus Parabeggiatoa sp.]|nr:hypothetical protein [Candidatus Parabeggiatoa sp.]